MSAPILCRNSVQYQIPVMRRNSRRQNELYPAGGFIDDPRMNLVLIAMTWWKALGILISIAILWVCVAGFLHLGAPDMFRVLRFFRVAHDERRFVSAFRKFVWAITAFVLAFLAWAFVSSLVHS